MGTWKKECLNLAIDTSKLASADASSGGKAKLRLETALTDLETVLEDKLVKVLNTENVNEELNQAKQQIADLKMKNRSIAARLDVAIKKLKDILSV